MSEISRRKLIAILGGVGPALAIGAGNSNVSTVNEDLISKISRLTKEREAINERLAEELKEYSRSQKSSWQKLPYLILQNEGRTGYSDWATMAYCYGLLSCDAKLYIDLENGELLNRYRSHLPAETGHILQLSIEDLDAEAMVNCYKKMLSEPEKEYGSNDSIVKRITWRQEQIAKFNLNPNTFKRTYNLSGYGNYHA